MALLGLDEGCLVDGFPLVMLLGTFLLHLSLHSCPEILASPSVVISPGPFSGPKADALGEAVALMSLGT